MATWFVYDSSNGIRTQVSESQLPEIVAAVPPEKLKKTFFWKDGFADWCALPTLPELMKMRSSKGPPPVPPPRNSTTTSTQASVSTAKAKSSTQQSVQKTKTRTSGQEERRRSQRQKGRLRVILVADGILFRSFSKDVSEHGLQVENAVPKAFFGRKLECYLSSPDLKSSLRFQAKLIESQNELLRFQFIGEGPEGEVLQKWLAEVSKNVKRAR